MSLRQNTVSEVDIKDTILLLCFLHQGNNWHYDQATPAEFNFYQIKPNFLALLAQRETHTI